jgi:hypothetical protein
MAHAFSKEPAFDVTISSAATVFTVGSPVRVEITIVNHSDRTLLFVNSRCGPKEAGIIVRDDHQEQLLPRERWREETDTRPCNLGGGVGPHKNVEEAINVAEWFDLSRAGLYSIKLTKTNAGTADTREARESNVLKIEIVERKSE